MKSILLIVFVGGYVLANSVEFISPKEGEKLLSPVKVKMGVSGLKVRAAGEDVNDKKSGHHHIVIDGAAVEEGQAVPADEKHIHFGKGQTETEVKLSPGKHTLTLQLADGAHKSYGPKMSKTINIEVIEEVKKNK